MAQIFVPSDEIEREIQDQVGDPRDVNVVVSGVGNKEEFGDVVFVTGNAQIANSGSLVTVPYIARFQLSPFFPPVLMEVQPFLPGDGASGQSTDISGDPFLTGFADAGGPTPFHAFVYDTETQNFRDLGAFSDIGFSFGLGVDEFGTVVVGAATLGADGVSPGLVIGHAFRWTEATGMVDLGTMAGPLGFSRALDVSGDGAVVIGETDLPRGVVHAFRWTEADGFEDLGANVSDRSIATAISVNGETIVGGDGQAFRWTEAAGMIGLGAPAGFNFSIATDVSDNGDIVVGNYDNLRIRVSNNGQAEFQDSSRAFRWTDETQGGDGIADLTQLATDAGVDLTGSMLISADGISSDGQFIFGNLLRDDAVGFDPQPYILNFCDDFVDNCTNAIFATTNIDGLSLVGDGGNNTLFGGMANDQLSGLAGDDILIGRDGDDFLLGGDGFDRLNGGDGADMMVGGDGDDIYTVDDVGDTVMEEAESLSRDRINTFVDYTNPNNVEFLVGLFANRGLQLTGSNDRESITGANRISSGDTINAMAGHDRVVGLVGDDVIQGGAGNDRIFGNSGMDLITGGEGNDRLTGQFGPDTFFHNPGDDRDRITDFNVNEDLLDLTGHNFNTFDEVRALLSDVNGGALLDLAGNDAIVFEGLAANTIAMEDVLI